MYQHHCKVFVIITIMINNNNIILSTIKVLLPENFQCCMVCSYFLDVQILSKNQNGITQSALDQFTPNQDPFLLYIIVEDVTITIVFVVVGASPSYHRQRSLAPSFFTIVHCNVPGPVPLPLPYSSHACEPPLVLVCHLHDDVAEQYTREKEQ